MTLRDTKFFNYVYVPHMPALLESRCRVHEHYPAGKHKDKQWLELQLLACSDSIENYTHDDDDASQAALSKLTGLLEDTPRLESSTAVDRLLNVLTNIMCVTATSRHWTVI